MNARANSRLQLVGVLICLAHAVSVSAQEPTADAATATVARPWGRLIGRFVYLGPAPKPRPLRVTNHMDVCGKKPLMDESLLVDKCGGLANAVVYVRTKGVKVHESHQKTAKADAVLTAEHCRYSPRVLTMRMGQKLVFRNRDPVPLAPSFQPIGAPGISNLIPGNKSASIEIHRAQYIPVPAQCNLHPWMRAYVLPRETPYAAVTDAGGRFAIEHLPAGKLEFQTWHERAGYLRRPDHPRGRFTARIRPGKTTHLGVIKLPAELFAR